MLIWSAADTPRYDTLVLTPPGAVARALSRDLARALARDLALVCARVRAPARSLARALARPCSRPWSFPCTRVRASPRAHVRTCPCARPLAHVPLCSRPCVRPLVHVLTFTRACPYARDQVPPLRGQDRWHGGVLRRPGAPDPACPHHLWPRAAHVLHTKASNAVDTSSSVTTMPSLPFGGALLPPCHHHHSGALCC